MTDDLKAKADAAWAMLRNGFNGESLERYRAAVEASIAVATHEYLFRATTVAESTIAAALSPVLERVGRLEKWVQDDMVSAAHVREPKPPAPCDTCGGARFVCDSGKASWGKSWPCMNEDHVVAENRRPCPECSESAQQFAEEFKSKWEDPCAQCGGARFVCDAGGEGRPCPQESHAYVRNYNRRACPDCSKPAASTEAPPHIEAIRNDLANNPDRKLSISDLRTYIAWLESRHSPAPAATDFRGTIAPGTTISVDVGPGQNISPAESHGVPQSSPQAPERVEMFEMVHSDGERYWTSRRKRVGMDGSPKPDAQGGTPFIRHDLLAAAERRIAELEAQNTAMARTILALLDKKPEVGT